MLRKNFNQDWYFGKDSGTMFAVPTELTPVALPHDAMALEERSSENPSGNAGGFFPGGNYIYKKKFMVSEEQKGHKLLLGFEGAYDQAKVYVNGDFVCGNQYGYTEFYADISGYVHFGQENLIEVKVENGNIPNSRWYSGSGIYRPVTMLTGGEVYVDADGLRISTPEAAEDVSVIETAIQLRYQGRGTKKVRICTEIRESGSDEVILMEKTPVTLFAGDAPCIRQRLYLSQAKLWSLNAPNLYTCHVNICEAEDGSLLDETEETFGIRHIQIDPVYGLRINGERVLLRGSCIHHDNGVIGAATFAAAEERRVRLSREAGFNAFRIAHNPASRSFLEACDRLGMLVMEESFDMWNHSKSAYDHAQVFDRHWDEEAEAIVAKDFNHPSVIMYSIGNEIQEIGTGAGARLNRQIAEKFRQLDPTRFVTNAVNGLMTVMDKMGKILSDLNLAPKQENGRENGDINDLMTAAMGNMGELVSHPLVGERIEESCSGLDISGYNYMTGRYDRDSKEYPNRLIVGSETYAPQIAENWKHVKENPAILGDFTWTGYDYIGEAGIGVPGYNGPGGFLTQYPCYLANVGDIDLLGFRRPMSYYREIVWGLRKKPYLAVQIPEHYGESCSLTPWITEHAESNWTWPGYEGKPCKVEIYSAEEEVELLVNGISCGKMPAGEEQGYKAVFDTIYTPGSVTAVAYCQGKETGRHEVSTAGPEEVLSIETENTELKAGGEDLAFLLISVRDKKGILQMASKKKISVHVTGAGVLLGYGSADPFSTENFYDSVRTVYRGMVLAVIRSGNEDGEIVVKAEADGCAAAEIRLTVRENY